MGINRDLGIPVGLESLLKDIITENFPHIEDDTTI